MILYCPRCQTQHVDAPNPDIEWTNPPHRSHLCHNCGFIWRPADVDTIGVAAIATRGTKDSPAVAIDKTSAMAALREMILTEEYGQEVCPCGGPPCQIIGAPCHRDRERLVRREHRIETEAFNRGRDAGLLLADMGTRPPVPGEEGEFLVLIHCEQADEPVCDTVFAADGMKVRLPFTAAGAQKVGWAFLRAVGRAWRHLRRGTTYRVIVVADVQGTLKEGDRAVVYLGDEDDRFHVREYEEFHDGRFEEIKP